MIDPLGHSQAALPVENHAAGSGRKVLRMVTNDRTAGSMPVWERPDSATQRIEESLASAGGATGSFSATLAYQQQQADRAQSDAPTEFGFGDLVDMINPLQHIPVVSYIYRNVTGDEIRPISQIVGGAVFGGALGAAGGLVNVIVQEETGKDITENAIAMATSGDAPTMRSNSVDTPQERLNDAARYAEQGGMPADMPGALLAFTDLGHGSGVVIRKSDEEERKDLLAQRQERAYPETDNLPAREPITELAWRTMPYTIY